jgi:hypothetical protein
VTRVGRTAAAGGPDLCQRENLPTVRCPPWCQELKTGGEGGGEGGGRAAGRVGRRRRWVRRGGGGECTRATGGWVISFPAGRAAGNRPIEQMVASPAGSSPTERGHFPVGFGTKEEGTHHVTTSHARSQPAGTTNGAGGRVQGDGKILTQTDPIQAQATPN